MSDFIHIPLTKEEEEDIDGVFEISSLEDESEHEYEEQHEFGKPTALI